MAAPHAFRRGPNGVHFVPARNKLYLFDEQTILVLRGWPRPRAWRKTRREPRWRGCRPLDVWLERGQLDALTRSRAASTPVDGVPSPCARCGATQRTGSGMCPACSWQVDWLRARARQRFWARVPPRVRDAIAAFPERHWHLLQLAARVPGAVELIESNRALAACLASAWVFRSVTDHLRAARRLIGRRRREIAGWLGFPARESAVRVLGRVAAEQTTIERLLYLRAALHDRGLARRLAHQPTLSWAVLRILGDPVLAALVSPRAVAELRRAGRGGDEVTGNLVWTVEIMRRAGLAPPAIDSIAAIQIAHGRALELHASAQRWTATEVEPPVPGTDDIRPLRTRAEVIAEGIAMQHCAGSYWPDVARGSCYLYRVLAPERATARLTLSDPRGPRLVELAGPRNAQVAEATRDALTEWLRYPPAVTPRSRRDRQLLLPLDGLELDGTGAGDCRPRGPPRSRTCSRPTTSC